MTVDGKAVEFQMYALLDEKGNGTNYIKLRDMAYILNGTEAQFSVGYDNASKSISVRTGEAYQAGGSEMTTPFVQSALYTLVNSRLTAGKATVISSNLSMDGVRGRYNGQTASRLEGEYRTLRFFGEDIRLQRKAKL